MGDDAVSIWEASTTIGRGVDETLEKLLNIAALTDSKPGEIVAL